MSAEVTPFRRGKGFYLGAVIAAAAYLLTFLLVGVLALFAMPQADDFCYASNAMTNGLWGAPVQEYVSWGGRYSATFVMALLTLHWDLVGQYWIVTLLIMGSLAAGLFAFLWALLGKWQLALLLTVPILATAIVALPKPGETLFWLAGGVTYGLSGGLFMAWMAGLLVMLRRTKPIGFPGVILCIFLALFGGLLAGFQESLMFMLVASSTLAAVASWLVQRPCQTWLGLGVIAIVCLAAGLIVVLAPGASNRAGTHEFASNLLVTPLVQILVTLVGAVLAGPAQLGAWLSAIALLALSDIQRPRYGRRLLVFVCVASVLVCMAGALAPAWGLGAPPSPRAFTPFYLIGLMTFLFFLGAWAPTLQEQVRRLGWSPVNRGRLIGVLLGLHGLSIFSSDFIGEAVTNLAIGGTTPAADYRAQWQARYDEIDAAVDEGLDELALAPLTFQPSLLSLSDPIEGGWEAGCFNRYAPLKRVYIE